MNFTIKYHKAAQACMCLQGKPLQNWDSSDMYLNAVPQKTCSFKDVDYDTNQTIRDGLLHGFCAYQSKGYNVINSANTIVPANMCLFYGLTAYASSEKLENFSEDAYKVESQVGTATQSFSYGYTNNTYSVSVSNASGQEDIKVNCIKFTKPLVISKEDNYSAKSCVCLVYSCYLDEEVTIPAGSEKVFVVNFSFINA